MTEDEQKEYEKLNARKEKAESLSPDEVIKYLPAYIKIVKRISELENKLDFDIHALNITGVISLGLAASIDWKIVDIFVGKFIELIQSRDIVAVSILIELMYNYKNKE